LEAKNLYQKRVELGQDIYDLCLQEYGNLEAVFLLLEDNPDIDLQIELQAGQTLNFRVVLPVEIPRKNAEMQFYRDNKVRVNCTDGEAMDDNDAVDGGILISSGNYILADNGAVILESVPADIPEIPTGILATADGLAILQSNGNLIIVNTPPEITTNAGLSILSSAGLSIWQAIRPDHFVLAANGAMMLNSKGNYLKIN
jgi:hypothetical protein